MPEFKPGDRVAVEGSGCATVKCALETSTAYVVRLDTPDVDGMCIVTESADRLSPLPEPVSESEEDQRERGRAAIVAEGEAWAEELEGKGRTGGAAIAKDLIYVVNEYRRMLAERTRERDCARSTRDAYLRILEGERALVEAARSIAESAEKIAAQAREDMPDHEEPELADRLAWVFNEPAPADVVARMKESARRAFETTSSPPGYGPLRGVREDMPGHDADELGVEPERCPVVETAYGPLPVGTKLAALPEGGDRFDWTLSVEGWTRADRHYQAPVDDRFGVAARIIPPLAHDAAGYPLYEGDRVEFKWDGVSTFHPATMSTRNGEVVYRGLNGATYWWPTPKATLRKIHEPEPTSPVRRRCSRQPGETS